MSNIGFIGLGKLGLPCALAVESKGHKVWGYDINPEVEEILSTKKLPYREIWAQDHLDKSEIKFSSIKDVVSNSDIIFVPIQTPHNKRFEGTTRIPEDRVDFNYSFLKAGIKSLSEDIERQGEDKVVIIISTVLPGTIEREIKPLLSNNIKLCYNPFFIAMGTTMRDFLNPEYVLFGVDDEEAAIKAAEFYRTLHDRPFYKTAIKNAELIKVAYNTFIGMKIGYANTMMEICHKIGADVDEVTGAMSLATDRLISGKYLSGGMGDGGGCHPRDNIAMSWLAKKLDLSYDFFESLMLGREYQTEWLADLIEGHKGDLPVMILGKAFKEETNLTVGSPSILLKNILEERGIEVEMYDPHVDEEIELNIGVHRRGELVEVDEPHLFFIGTKHSEFNYYRFSEGSVVIDPWRYMEDQEGVEVIRIGEHLER
jgi:UDPglucose 6-dehydrogenase